ncbi:MAG TPA: DUF2961 domain-containing protein [Phycisphaerae bacterium]|nr:DUF2961 domain-containing protein [Phycisphaerae bacterium]HRY66703.1 DUF2961 domain-containing protein [Phycisphaerae bacterium]HSA27594.1 DUF2961 domain-containing protein [Phycisphaerae bacterium]
MHRAGYALFAVVVLAGIAGPVSAAPDGWVLGIEELYRLDRLPMFKDSVKVASVSSYDRSGGNDDGFSGKYSFVRKEADGLVLADLKGPGIVYRLWTPTPTDDVFGFYFDGEEAPRIEVKFREIFMGKQAPFVSPLVGFGAGGFYCYVPLPYQKSLKVLAKAQKIQFYQINYATYPDGAPVKSFDPKPSPEYLAHQEKACKLFGSSGLDISPLGSPAGAFPADHAVSAVLKPGASATLFETDRGGRIVGLRIGPMSQLGGKARDVLLKVTWNGTSGPAILCPVGDFFGSAWGRPAMTGLMLGTRNDEGYCYFPMPFEKSAKVELVSERRDGGAIGVTGHVVVAAVPRAADEGRFYALWRRENPTTKGEPFTFIDTPGRGHLVGCLIQAQGEQPGGTLFFEGDDQTWLDGELTIHGTGSEDFFNGGWYDVPGRWDQRRSFPLSGCLDYLKHLGRTGAYRFMLTDAYAYRKSLRQCIEHGGDKNSEQGDYAGLTLLYSENAPAGCGTVPEAGRRVVVDPKRITFAAGWNIPVKGFSFDGATLTKKGEKVGGHDVRFTSLQAAKEHDWFGPPFLCLTVDLPAAGRYAVSVEVVKGPAQAKVQLFGNEAPVGEPVDMYAASRVRSEVIPLGVMDLVEGNNDLMLKLVGKNSSSTGLGIDLVSIVCERKD